MSLQLHSFNPDDSTQWDSFCVDAHQATFLHTREFLSYHGDRFLDCSMMIERNGHLIALFPAAYHPEQAATVVSHPGISYGGLLFQSNVRGTDVLEIMRALCCEYSNAGANRLIYKAVPAFYHKVPAQDDIYSLFRLGAVRTRCDLSSAIDLARRNPLATRRKRGLKKAFREGVEIREGADYLRYLWPVLADNLRRKHGAVPVHTVHEICLLADRFPENISCVVGLQEERVEAGVVLFSTEAVDHAQYIASSQRGYEICALDALFDYCIERAIGFGRRWFDFGISTEGGGMLLNDGLYEFKSGFGGGGLVHEFFEITL